MYRIVFIVSLVIISAHTAMGLPGSGTQEDPWLIQSLEDFTDFTADANYWDGWTRLETDVNLAGLTYSTAVIAPEGTNFTGVFDGNDHKITSLRVASMYSNMGLFGHNRGQIKNLGIEGASISGRSSVGALVGYNKKGGSVSNCYSTGEVMGSYRGAGGLVGANYEGGSISNCYSTCEVSGRDNVGGLVGTNSAWSIISNCSSSSNVSGEDNVGGLVGDNSGWASVSRCYSTGTVSGLHDVGGLVGENWNGSISNCYCIGTVSGDNSVGGLLGDNYYSSNVSDCYSSVDVEGTGQLVGGLVGQNDNKGIVRNCFWDTDIQTHDVNDSIGFNGGTVTNVYSLTTSEMQTKSTFTSAGWDFIGESTDGKSETWQMPDGGGYPEICFFHVEIPAPLEGSGTVSDPYLISDSNELGMVNWYATDCCFKLTSDVDLSGINWSVPVVPLFNGFFDGNSHIISGMQVSGDWRLGLFGFLGKGGQVRNTGLEGGSVNGTGDRIGGLVGENNEGSVSNCYSICSVIGSGADIGGLVGMNRGNVLDCYSSGYTNGTGTDVGGLVGYNDTIVSNCYSSGDVSGESHVGGLVGRNYTGSVLNCYSTGKTSGNDYVGGLVGNNSSVLSNCYSTGETNGNEYVGGLVGYNYASLTNCYSTGDVNGLDDVGGLVGRNSGGMLNCFWDTETQSHGVTDRLGSSSGTVTNVAGLSSTQMQAESTFTSGGWDFVGESANGTSENWQMPSGGGYPVLSSFHSNIPVPLAGSGTATDPYLIGDANELGMVSWYPKDCCFKLTSDIDMSEIKWSVSVVPVFSGYFEGDGHKIVNIQISGGSWLGLFGYIQEDGQVKNLGLEGGYVTGTGSNNGGLVGYCRMGNIWNCYSTVDVIGYTGIGCLVGHFVFGNVSHCYSTGNVNGKNGIGGLVGFGLHVDMSHCYSTGGVSGTGREVGGLVGQCRGTVSDCYCTGDVSGYFRVGGLAGYSEYGEVSNCYSTGDVSGDIDVGGLLGLNNHGSVSNCFWDTDTQTHGIVDSIGRNTGVNVKNVAGLPTAEMQTKSTFTSSAWDFVDIWDFTCEGMSYARFIWQITPADFLCPHGVDFRDYSFFAGYWGDTNCEFANDCDGTDLDFSGTVSIGDFDIFCDYWLNGAGG